jgi:site-specific DNA recombinase
MKAVLYARVSSDRQDIDLSISAQLKALREYAARNGHQIIKEFVDEAESGKTTARPAFREMIAYARRSQKPFELILVWKYSRFARSREDSIVFKTMLRKNGVRVVSINEPAEDTPTGKLMEAMIESLDEFYSANLGEEVTRGLRESASRGFYVTPIAPYGYRKIKVKDGGKERPKLEIEPDQARIVTRIYNEALEGKGLINIVKQLNNDGIAAPRGKGWIKTTISKILTNEAYTGTFLFGRDSIRDLPIIKVENAIPAIVDKHTFSQVQNLLKARTRVMIHPRRLTSRYLLSGLARCGHCGKALVGQDAKSGKFTYYVCGTLLKKGAGSCQTNYLVSQKFEKLVIDKIKEHVLNIENLTTLVKIVNEEMDGLAIEYQERLGSIDREIIDVEHRLEKLYDALETGSISLSDLSPRIQQQRQRQELLKKAKEQLAQELSERRLELADAETVSKCIAYLQNLLSESSLVERKSFIRSFVKDIKVTGNEVLLTYTIPMLPKGLTEERLPVLCIVHDGGQYWIRTSDPCDVNAVLYR